MMALPNWLMLLTQTILRADSLACAKTGMSIDARIPIIAITTSSSMSVKARCARQRILFSLILRSFRNRPDDKRSGRSNAVTCNEFTANGPGYEREGPSGLYERTNETSIAQVSLMSDRQVSQFGGLLPVGRLNTGAWVIP